MLVTNENNVRKTVTGLTPRWYQENLIRAIFKEGYKRLLLVWSRRAGKDVITWNIAIWHCLSKKSVVWYIFPNQRQARDVLWTGMTMDGRTFRSYIPEHTILKINEARLEVYFRNGSVLCLKGSTSPDTLRGANPSFIVFSEYAYQVPTVFPLIILPILRGNPQAIALFISTPFGTNHFFELAEIAKNTPDEWYYDFLTVEQTGHIDINLIEKDIQMGIISRDQVEQEYYCNFSKGVQGSVFGRQLNKLKLDDRLTFVPYESAHPVHVSADIGWDDEFAFIFFQVIGQAVRIIDCYSNRLQDIPFYVERLFEKKYNYGTLILPHDATVHSVNDGNTRVDIFENLGFKCHVLPRKSIPDQIEDGRKIFARLWIDERSCKDLIRSLENYRREWDDKLQRYKDAPIHDQFSHYADAFKYMADGVSIVGPAMTQHDADNIRERAISKQSSWVQQYHQWGSR